MIISVNIQTQIFSNDLNFNPTIKLIQMLKNQQKKITTYAETHTSYLHQQFDSKVVRNVWLDINQNQNIRAHTKLRKSKKK